MKFSPVNDALDVILAKSFNTSADTFRFHESLPFGTFPVVFATTVGYVALMLSGKQIMKNYQPFVLKVPIFLHNLIMSVASAILFVLIMEPLIPMLYERGLNYSVCNKEAYTPRLELLYYFNFLFKIWEFIDTAFIVLRKRPLEFLHVYHHSATALMAFMFVVKPQSSLWFYILINLFVHVLMYYYFAVTALSIKIWWKKYLTTMQIIQFVVDLALIGFLVYNVFAADLFPWIVTDYGFPVISDCYSADPHLHAGVASFVLFSYLVLFMDFYRRTYNKKDGASKSKANGAAKVNGNTDSHAKTHHPNRQTTTNQKEE
ncbi:very-long-chain 3-oxoacyl-CoA synthase [Synchytrium microbalum]|uniref:Elongation of fatty acids protein n=1 Tax=Synchytrium microbalum TaxID=1806994 RepID=A0A507C8Y6_9FUNG|nr:very-long-chain 3-oxoacyl-CoA synthase [Synchytrium microbalum]TPX37517.1 very-long-chain 3-oxoacyl-CoA synthase [Synchytrium microbalum]